MKVRTTLILVAVCAALGAYVYLSEDKGTNESAAGTPTPTGPWSVSVEQVVGITLRAAGKETRLARPVDGEWRLEAPVTDAADHERVTRALQQLTYATPSRSFPELPGPALDYGLNEPSLEVTLSLADGKSVVLKVGSQNPQQTDSYVQVEGQPTLYMLPGYSIEALREMLNQPPVRPTPTPTAVSTPTAVATATPTATPN